MPTTQEERDAIYLANSNARQSLQNALSDLRANNRSADADAIEANFFRGQESLWDAIDRAAPLMADQSAAASSVADGHAARDLSPPVEAFRLMNAEEYAELSASARAQVDAMSPADRPITEPERLRGQPLAAAKDADRLANPQNYQRPQNG